MDADETAIFRHRIFLTLWEKQASRSGVLSSGIIEEVLEAAEKVYDFVTAPPQPRTSSG